MGQDHGTEIEKMLAEQTLARVREKQQLQHKKRSRKSKLDLYRDDLTQLCEAGASLAQLKIFLRIEKKCEASRSTIERWLKKHQLKTRNPAPKRFSQNTSQER